MGELQRTIDLDGRITYAAEGRLVLAVRPPRIQAVRLRLRGVGPYIPHARRRPPREVRSMVIQTEPEVNGQQMAAYTPPEKITISPPRFTRLKLRLQGTAPYMQARFSEKAQQQMAEKMKQGSTATKGKNRKARDFDDDFRQAQHVSEEGWFGVPAAAFRNAAIDACRMAGYQMTRAKMSIFVASDGLDVLDQSPLIRLQADEPQRTEMMVRNATGVPDIRIRPLWREWAVEIIVTFDADQFTAADVYNLFNRAGQQVGIGEGRPFSRQSNGMGFGLFKIERSGELDEYTD